MAGWVAPALGAASGLGSGLISAAAQGKRDHDARNFALMQGDIEWDRNKQGWSMQNDRDDVLWNRQNAYNDMQWNKQNEYNLSLWNRQNEYDSPMAQMQRFKEAGLNPNLIYGQNNTGGSIQTANLETSKPGSSGPPRGTRPSDWRPGPQPTYNLIDGLMSGLAFREKAAQIDNLKEQNNVLKEEAALKEATKAATLAGIGLTNINTKRGEFQFGLDSELRSTSVDATKASLRKMQIEADLALRADERASVMQGSNLSEAQERIQTMRGQRENQQLDQELKKMDIEMKKLGIQPSDNLMFRILGRMYGKLEDFGKTNTKNELGDYIFDLQR